nr:hypothetical protein [uncultured Rhodopila sp.]
MIRFAWYESGALFGIRYDFDRGDALPWHAHDKDTAHNIVILDGLVRLVLPGAERLGLAGDVLDFDNAVRHTIRCESTTARILNLFLNGMPADYRTLPITERAGVLGVQIGDTN